MEKRRPKKEPSQNFGGGPADARRILNLTDGSEKPLGEWNTMQIECKNNKILEVLYFYRNIFLIFL